MIFTWQEYIPAHASVVEPWLDAEAIKGTGLDEGFDNFCNYWKKEDGMENFRAFLILDNNEPVAAIAIDLYEHFVKVMEIVVNPLKRGRGIGSKIINELTEFSNKLYSDEIFGYEAIIFPSNTASRKAFAKSGYTIDENNREGDLWRNVVKMGV